VLLGLGPGCWSQGVIPKEPAADPAKSAAAGKKESCASDNECSGDLVCEEERCISWHQMSGPVPEASREELAEMLKKGEVQILDVRTKAEFAMGHVEGALNVPIAKLDDEIERLPLDPDRPIVTICLTAHRSIAATRLLQRHGYEVSQLEGGWIRVKKGDLPRARGKAE
jgi:rhodanese-related sulfurtransferase